MKTSDYTLFCNHLWELIKHDRVSRSKWATLINQLDHTGRLIRKLRSVDDEEEITYQDIISLTHDELDKVIEIIGDDPLGWLERGIAEGVPTSYLLQDLPKYRDLYSKQLYKRLADLLKCNVDEGVGLDVITIKNGYEIHHTFDVVSACDIVGEPVDREVLQLYPIE